MLVSRVLSFHRLLDCDKKWIKAAIFQKLGSSNVGSLPSLSHLMNS